MRKLRGYKRSTRLKSSSSSEARQLGQQTERLDESEVARDIDVGLIRAGVTVLSMYIESTTSRWYWTRESGSEKLLFRIPRIARSAFINVFWDRMLVYWPQIWYVTFWSCIICEWRLSPL